MRKIETLKGFPSAPTSIKEYGSIDTSRHNEETPWKTLNDEAKRAKKRHETSNRRWAAEDRRRQAEQRQELLQEQQSDPDAAADRGNNFDENEDEEEDDPMEVALPPQAAAPDPTPPQRITTGDDMFSKMGQYMSALPPTRESYSKNPLKIGDKFDSREEAEVIAAAAHVNTGVLTWNVHTHPDHFERRCPCQAHLPKNQRQKCAVITFSKLTNTKWQCSSLSKRVCEGEPDNQHIKCYGASNYSLPMILPLMLRHHDLEEGRIVRPRNLKADLRNYLSRDPSPTWLTNLGKYVKLWHDGPPQVSSGLGSGSCSHWPMLQSALKQRGWTVDAEWCSANEMQTIVNKKSRSAFEASQEELGKAAKNNNNATFVRKTWDKNMAPKVQARIDGVTARYLKRWTLSPEYAKMLIGHGIHVFAADFAHAHESHDGGVGGVYGVVATHDAARKILVVTISWNAANEGTGTWDNLLAATKSAVHGFDDEKNILLTDGSKGADAAIDKTSLRRVYDSVHVSENIREKFKGKGDEYKDLYLAAVKATNSTELDAAKAKYTPELAHYLARKGADNTRIQLAFVILAVIQPLMLLSR